MSPRDARRCRPPLRGSSRGTLKMKRGVLPTRRVPSVSERRWESADRRCAAPLGCRKTREMKHALVCRRDRGNLPTAAARLLSGDTEDEKGCTADQASVLCAQATVGICRPPLRGSSRVSKTKRNEGCTRVPHGLRKSADRRCAAPLRVTIKGNRGHRK